MSRENWTTRFSLRGLSNTGLAAFAFCVLASAAGLLWSSLLLEDTTRQLVRSGRAMELGTEIQTHLLNYQRMANIEFLTGDPAAHAGARAVEDDIRNTLQTARAAAERPQTHALLDQVAVHTEIYLQKRKELTEAVDDLPTVIRGSRPALNDALGHLEALQNMHAADAEAARDRADKVAAVFKISAVLLSVACLIALIVAVVGVRRWVLRPIYSLQHRIVAFRSGDHEARVEEQGPRELTEIATAFNEMSEAIASQKRNQLAFLGGVVHDLRNPLAGLDLGVQKLRLMTSPDERTKNTLDMFDRQISRLTRMLGDLLDASRIEAGQLDLDLQTCELRQVVDEVIELYRPTAEQHEIRISKPPTPVRVAGDRLRLEQVFSNLLSNAIKYSPDGGPIDVEITCADGNAKVAVVDHGIGISEDELKDIFVPFFRRPSARAVGKGTGLGLSVVRRIVLAHGGDITVESTKGKGSEFCVILPLAPEAREASTFRIPRFAGSSGRG